MFEIPTKIKKETAETKENNRKKTKTKVKQNVTLMNY